MIHLILYTLNTALHNIAYLLEFMEQIKCHLHLKKKRHFNLAFKIPCANGCVCKKKGHDFEKGPEGYQT